MVTETDYAVEHAARRPSDAVLEHLAERVGASASAKAVYGEPVERDGVTVIPVARMRYGFGAGGGDKEGSRGGGGGGGVDARPMGYIEIKNGSTAYRPIWDAASLVPVVAGGLLSLLLLRRIVRL